jgi:hypothetical protein
MIPTDAAFEIVKTLFEQIDEAERDARLGRELMRLGLADDFWLAVSIFEDLRYKLGYADSLKSKKLNEIKLMAGSLLRSERATF